jgi:alcohol dehydrogenase YqhD (iron-dependent ADH family)
MENFIYYIPTRIYFGRQQVQYLAEVIKQYGRKVLLVYGCGSIKKNGVYDAVTKQLSEYNLEFYELAGVEPNPKIQTVKKGIELCRQHNIDVLLPVGGGSALDCAKIIGVGFFYSGDAWDIVVNPKLIKKTLPVISVLTLSASGSEMNTSAVISNLDTKDKVDVKHELLRPVAAFMDPSYTNTVNAYHTAAGTADIMSHTLESYFSNKRGYLQDRIAEGIMKTCIEFGLKAIQKPDDYDARANLMWAGSWAVNDLIVLGKKEQFSVHPMEHQLSAYYDITHGVGLAILTIPWMQYVLNKRTVDKFCEYGLNVWDIDVFGDRFTKANLAIEKTKEFFIALGLPANLRDIGINDQYFDVMAEKAAVFLDKAYVPLSKDDVKKIFYSAL